MILPHQKHSLREIFSIRFNSSIKFITLILFLVLNTSIYSNDEENSRFEFLRLTNEALQTPVYYLTNKEKTINLKLIGIIHIADPIYYKAIQKISKEVDILYFEGVKMHNKQSSIFYPKEFSYLAQSNQINEQIKQELKLFNNTQSIVGRLFNLANQEEHLIPDKHWVNADISLEELMLIMSTKTINYSEIESSLSLELKSSPEFMNEKNNKRKFARSILKSTEELCYNEKLKPLREALIEERNRIAISLVKEKMNTTEILDLGILYGSAHLPHFLSSLKKDNFSIYYVEWLDAWSFKN
ncbi:MAG: hypothetical protein SFU98_00430 [Leptospiraceae bacterium]|nr:hypothetical protein [Leptospiraceae bacterium]